MPSTTSSTQPREPASRGASGPRRPSPRPDTRPQAHSKVRPRQEQADRTLRATSARASRALVSTLASQLVVCAQRRMRDLRQLDTCCKSLWSGGTGNLLFVEVEIRPYIYLRASQSSKGDLRLRFVQAWPGGGHTGRSGRQGHPSRDAHWRRQEPLLPGARADAGEPDSDSLAPDLTDERPGRLPASELCLDAATLHSGLSPEERWEVERRVRTGR